MNRRYAIAVCLALLTSTDVAQSTAVRTVALTGQQAAGTDGGVTYDTFGAYFSGPPIARVFRGPALNDAGQVAFRSNLMGDGVNATNNRGVWSEGSGNLALVARTGNAAPGSGTFGPFSQAEIYSPTFNDAGQTAFWGALTNGGVGLWSEGSGNLAVVAREGLSAAGTPTGVSYSFAGLFPDFSRAFDVPPLLNNAGQTAFTSVLQGTGINSTNNTGIWSGSAGDLSVVIRRGTQAAGAPNGANYDFAHLPIGLNDVGQLVVYSFLDGSGVNELNWAGIWSGGLDSLALVARLGDPAPGTAGGVSFATLTGTPGINIGGQIAIQSSLVGTDVNSANDDGQWSTVSGSLALFAREGSQAAGAPVGVKYAGATAWTVLNDAGQIAFVSELTGIGVDQTNDEGIWLGKTNDLMLVARRGSPAPGTASDVHFSDLQYPALNSAGQIAFRGDLAGSGIDDSNDNGIWATDSSSVLQLIARSGDMLEVAPGDFRTISDLNFSTASGNSDGRSSGFNNYGQLAFWASFTDGTQGVFVSDAVAFVAGDYNNNGIVDAADYTVWRNNLGGTSLLNRGPGITGPIGEADYNTWKANFGAALGAGGGMSPVGTAAKSPVVPEPTAIALATWVLGVLTCWRRAGASVSYDPAAGGRW